MQHDYVSCMQFKGSNFTNLTNEKCRINNLPLSYLEIEVCNIARFEVNNNTRKLSIEQKF